MALPGIVTLTSDFGTSDGFVAQMKGAALSIHRDLTFVDVTHDVPPHDVLAGALHLRTAFDVFPPGTVHVVVVDPGVGGSRRGVAVRTQRYYFVGPDNGVLSLALEREPPSAAHVLAASHLRREPVSATFEGRDVFAPAAAWIVRGLALERFGPAAGPLERVSLPRVELRPDEPVAARVLIIDRFGNATLNLSRADLALPGSGQAVSRLEARTPRGEVVDRLLRTYSDTEDDAPFLLFNSSGHLEVAVREGRAADRLGLAVGDEVVLVLRA